MPDLIDQGSRAFAQGDYAQAANAFRKLQSLYSGEAEWSEARLNEKLMPLAGYAALRAGLYDQAIDSLDLFLAEENAAYSQQIFAKYVLAVSFKRKGAFPEALEALAAFRDASHSPSQKGIARIHEADIHLQNDRSDEAIEILSGVVESDAAIRIRTQARLLSLREQLDRSDLASVSKLLLDSPWDSDTMPELAMLAFLAIEAGDALLQDESPEDALRAYQLVPSKTALVAKQTRKLDQLKRVFEDRRKDVGMGGVMWTDFYEQLIQSASAQLSALREAEDYSDALLLRRGRASLLSGRPFEAWLLFERLALHSPDATGEQAHFHWILAAKEMRRYSAAIEIATEYLELYPASKSIDDALYLIAQTLIDASRFEDAIQALTNLAKSASAQDLQTICLYQRGQCHMRVADYLSARTDFENVADQTSDELLKEHSELWIGISLFLENSFDSAFGIFEALAANATNIELQGEALYRMASCQYSQFDYKAAATSLKAFANDYPAHPREFEVQLLLGDCYSSLEQFEDAIQRYRTIPSEFPELAHLAALQTSFAYRELGQTDEALLTLQRRAKVDADPYRTTEIQLIHAEYQLETGDSTGALSTLDRLIASHGNAIAAENMLDALRVRNSIQPSDLSAQYQTAIDREQYCLAARFGLLLALDLRDRDLPFQSKETFLNLANEIPIEHMPPECLGYVGLELVSLDMNQGDAMLERLFAKYPNSGYLPFAYFGFAKNQANSKRFDLALGWLARIPESDWDSPIYVDALALQGEARMRTGGFVSAQTVLERILSLRWASSSQKANALLALGELKNAQGETKQAIAYCQRVFTLYPGVTDAAAKAYLKSAQHLDAIDEPGKAQEILTEFLARSEFRSTTQFQEAEAFSAQLLERAAQTKATGNES